MLLALCADFARIEGVKVVTTWDQRLGTFPLRDVDSVVIDRREHEQSAFDELTAAASATIVIAPEFHGILEQRVRRAIACGGRLLGPNPEAVQRCSDKLALAKFLQEHEISTIQTCAFDAWSERPAYPFPLVVKPRHGAGSVETRLIRDLKSWRRVQRDYRNDSTLMEAIQQPFVAGAPVSVSVIAQANGSRIEIFPPGRQQLSQDDRLQYQGGQWPTLLPEIAIEAIRTTVHNVCEVLPGLQGYFGLDLIVPDTRDSRPVIVEINPRLTTAYLGYRQLTHDNLAQRMLANHVADRPILWADHSVAIAVSSLRSLNVDLENGVQNGPTSGG